VSSEEEASDVSSGEEVEDDEEQAHALQISGLDDGDILLEELEPAGFERESMGASAVELSIERQVP